MKCTFSSERAHETQLRMSKRITFEDKLLKEIRLVGGIDVAYDRHNSIGAAVVLDFDSLRLVESQIASCKTRFPYIPTLLSFREIPPMVACIRKLQNHPDVFLVNGHGFAHPYRCGLASHLGLIINKPTIGVAKSRLVGEIEDCRKDASSAFVIHEGGVVGAAITVKPRCKPVYVSVGNMISLKTAIEIVKHCTRHSRIPEPILKAHETATRQKRKIHMP